MRLIAKILLTVAAIQYGFVPPIVDFSETHMFHPDWPPHARFHLVWLLAVGAALAAYVLFCIWNTSSRRPEVLRQASVIGCLVLGAFFLRPRSVLNTGDHSLIWHTLLKFSGLMGMYSLLRLRVFSRSPGL